MSNYGICCFIPHGETDRKSTFRIRLGMNKVRGLTQMIEIPLPHLLLFAFHNLESCIHPYNPLWGKYSKEGFHGERDEKRLVVTNSECEPWCYPLSQSLPPFTSLLYLVSFSLPLSILINLLVRVSSRLFLYCPPRCRLTEPYLALPSLHGSHRLEKYPRLALPSFATQL